MKSKYNFINLLVVMIFLASCQNAKKTNETKTQDLGILKFFNSKEYNKFIKLAEPEWEKNKQKGLLIPLSYANVYIGNTEKSIFYSNEMLKREPENYKALFVKAGCYLSLKKIDSAEIIYKKVIDINPSYARANLNLAQIYLIKEDKEKAIFQYISAIELFHKNDFKKEVILYSKQVLNIDPNNDVAKKFIEQYN